MTNPKETAGRQAAELVEDGMTVGLGTGSTVYFTLVRLAERIESEGLSIRGVPTSEDTSEKARVLGIPLASLNEVEATRLGVSGHLVLLPPLAGCPCDLDPTNNNRITAISQSH